MRRSCSRLAGNLPGALLWTAAAAALAVFWLSTAHCSRDISPDSGQGGIGLAWIPPPEGLGIATPESLAIRVWVLDQGGAVLAGPVRSTLGGGSDPIEMSLRVPAGENRTVRLQLEGRDRLGWGSLAAGETAGIDIPLGGQADALVQLRGTIPTLDSIEAEPGELYFDLTWSTVPGAAEYEVRESGPSGLRAWRTLDTSMSIGLRESGEFRSINGAPLGLRSAPPAADTKQRFFSGNSAAAPGVAGGIALSSGIRPRAYGRSDSDSTFYRVRSHLPMGGPSLYGDSVGLYLPALVDLPRVVEVIPREGATEVIDNSDILLTFDRLMDPSSLSDTTVTVTPVAGGDGILLRPGWDEGGLLLRLTPDSPMLRGEEYRIRVRTGLLGADGRPLDQAPDEPGLQGFESRFTTEVYNPLRVIAVDPPDRTVVDSLRPVITIHLNRAARAATVNAGTVLLADSSGSQAGCDVSLLPDSVTIRVRPQTALAFSRGYLLDVSSGVRDTRGSEGEPLDQNPATAEKEHFYSGFRTLEQPDGPRVVDAYPMDGERNHKHSQPVRVRFSRPVQPATVVNGRYSVRKQPVDSGIGGEITWNHDRTEFVFQPMGQGVPANFVRGDRYRIVIDPGGYDGQGEPFGILDDAGVPLDQQPEQAGYQGFSSLFRVEDNPGVLLIQPRDGRVRVPVDTVVVVRFTKPMDRTSVTTASLSLVTDDDATTIALDPYEFSGDTTQVTMRPVQPLSFLKAFRVRADTTLLSNRGSRFDDDLLAEGYQAFTSRFTTERESIPPRVEMVMPDSEAVGVSLDTSVNVWFTRRIRPASVNSETFTLKRVHPNPDSAQFVQGDRTVSSDSLTALLAPADSLRPSTRYEVRVTRFVEDLYGVQLDQDPIAHFRQDFVSHFTTDRERIPPQVVAVLPLDGAEDVPETTGVEIWFSEGMDAVTLPGAVKLLCAGDPVPGGLEISSGAQHVVFTPNAPLRNLQSYTVHVDTTATDAAGNALDMERGTQQADAFYSGFITRPDSIPPRVVLSDPEEGDSAVEVTVMPLIEFSEPVEPAGLETGGVRLLDAQMVDVPLAEVQPSADGKSVVLVPADSLLFLSWYHLEATPALTDTSGNALDQDEDEQGDQPFRASFRTRLENIPPRVIGVSYPGEEEYQGHPRVPVDFQVVATISEAVDPQSLVPGVVQLFELPSGLEVEMELPGLEDDSVILAQSSRPLIHDRSYELRIGGLTDLAGNVLDQDRSTPEPTPFLDTLRTLPDLIPPRVESVVPDPDSGLIPPSTEFLVQISEPVEESSVQAGVVLYLGASVVETEHFLTADSSAIRIMPLAPLEVGGAVTLWVTEELTDRAGNPLDQDHDLPGTQWFSAEYIVRFLPVPRAGPGVCSSGDGRTVVVDASDSFHPDGVIVQAIWIWGDGASDTLGVPGPDWPAMSHEYPCIDSRGCDEADNDGDGEVDEQGPSGCDESYKIILRVEDDDGFWAADTTGVSFCAFVALWSDPPDGADDVDPGLDTVAIRFSRPLDPLNVSHQSFVVREAFGDTLGLDLSLSPDSLVVSLALASGDTLRHSTQYEIHVSSALPDALGTTLDQDPCTPEADPYISGFRTADP